MANRPKRNPVFWLDYSGPDKALILGIECDDPSLTHDNNFVCFLKRRMGEKSDSGVWERGERLVKLLNRRSDHRGK